MYRMSPPKDIIDIDKLSDYRKPIFLDLGCGMKKYSKYHIGIDKSPNVGADIVLDFAKQQLPFDDETVDVINSDHAFEHITKDELMFTMNECWRVLRWTKDGDKDRGKMWVKVPHADCELAKQDPTHKNEFVKTSFNFFCGEYLTEHNLDYPIDCIFRLVQNREYVPEDVKIKGKDGKYCTMIKFGLAKNLEWYNMNIDKFPFKKTGTYIDPSDFEKKIKKHDINWFKHTRWKTDHNVLFSNRLKRVAKHAINRHMQKIMRIKHDAAKRYGVNNAPLGAKGLFADINRKYVRLRKYLWEGQTDTSEDIMDTLYDGAVYFVLAAIALEEAEMRRLRGEDQYNFGDEEEIWIKNLMERL